MGGVFLGYYVAYVAYLILAAQQHDTLQAFSGLMLGFVVGSLTVVTLNRDDHSPSAHPARLDRSNATETLTAECCHGDPDGQQEKPNGLGMTPISYASLAA